MEEIRQVMASKLKEFRKNAGMNVEQVGQLINKSGKTISAWEVGRGQPNADELITLCKAFGARISDFYGEPASTNMTNVPLYGAIAAGKPIEMLSIEDTQPIPSTVHEKYPDAFLLKVEGESMNRILPNGCYALVNPCTEVSQDNYPYAVCVNGYDATIKRVKKLANGFQLIPDSDDPTYQVKTYNYNEEGTERVTVIGKVVYYVLPHDWSF